MCAAVSCVSRRAKVLCDVCTDHKLKAVKSCSFCLASFCQTHLQPHLTVPELKRHQLMEPENNLQDSTDHSCICTVCPLLEHKNYECLSLQQTRPESQGLMEQRQLKIQEIWRSVELSEKELQIFTTLMQSVQKMQDQFIEELQEKHKQTLEQAEDLVLELKQEMSELQKRSTDQLPALKEWSTVRFKPEIFGSCSVRALSELQQKLNEQINVFKVTLMELKDLQEFAVDVTLDPDTANPRLFLSEDLKQVHDGGVVKKLPDSPQRLTYYICVLGKQSYSSGRFYFEVQVKGKTDWALGVARESIKRKEYLDWCPQSGVWVIGLNRDEFTAYTYPCVPLSLKCPLEKVGVFVDYDLGLVSFYDVHTADPIYTFTGCCFREKLFPFLNPGSRDGGRNTTPLILTVV